MRAHRIALLAGSLVALAPMACYGGVSQEYANVPSVDSLAALPVDEAAARWLEAKDADPPAARLSLAHRARRAVRWMVRLHDRDRLFDNGIRQVVPAGLALTWHPPLH
jgi:hypothetical protein